MRSIIALGLLAALAACSRTTSEHRYDSVAPGAPVPQGTECPDLAGTYDLASDSVAARFLGVHRAAGQGFSLLRIEHEPSGNGYHVILKPARASFEAAVAALAARDPAAHREWESLVAGRERARQGRQSVDVIESRIAAIGPLPDLLVIVMRSHCDAYWMMSSLGLDPAGYDDVGMPSPGGDDLELWLGRDADGALLYRIDRYRQRSLGVFGGSIRTGLTRHYDRLEAVDPARFAWSPVFAPPPKPSPSIPVGAPRAIPADVQAALVVDFSQATTRLLPDGVALTKVTPRPPPGDPVSRVVVDLAGTARRNADVSTLLRGIDGLAGVDGLELVSLRATEQQRIEFEIQVTLEPGGE